MSKTISHNSKIGWTQEEQSYLEVLCKNQKIPDWKYISTEMNAVFPERSRSSKQCRERFHNYIKFNKEQSKNSAWTLEEDDRLFKKYIEVGSKWAQISKSIPARSQNNIKNRFYGRLRKFIRSLNEVLRRSPHKNRKPIKQNTITKILSRQKFSNQFKINGEQEEGVSINFLEKLKFDIVCSVLDNEVETKQDRTFDILNRIHRFNLLAKAENIRENRKGKNIKRKRLPPLKKQTQQQGFNISEFQTYTAKPRVEEVKEVQPANLGDSPILKESYLNQLEFEEYFKNRRPSRDNVQNQITFVFELNKANVEKYDQFLFG